MIQLIKMFVDGDHGHIITGNLNIVNDLKLRKLMGYGTKFRLSSRLSVKQMMQQFTYDLDLLIYKISAYYNKPIQYFKQCNS